MKHASGKIFRFMAGVFCALALTAFLGCGPCSDSSEEDTGGRAEYAPPPHAAHTPHATPAPLPDPAPESEDEEYDGARSIIPGRPVTETPEGIPDPMTLE